MGPDYVPPDAPVAANWLVSSDPRIKTAAPQDAAWWQTLNDPKLSELVRIAQQQNPTVQTAGVRVLQARAQLGATIGDLYPQKQQVYGEVTHERLSDSESSRGLSRNVAQRSGVQRNLPSLDEQQLLGRAVRPRRELGAGSLGQVPTRDRIRGCQPLGLDRQLQRCPGKPHCAGGEHLRQRPHLRGTPAHLARERADPAREPESGRRPIPQRPDQRDRRRAGEIGIRADAQPDPATGDRAAPEINTL